MRDGHIIEQRRMSIVDHFAELARIEIRICAPLESIRVVSVRCSVEISSLQTLWPSPRRFIFKGLELNDTLTFYSCGIADGDAVIALPKCEVEQGHPTSHWLNLTRDQEGFNDSMRYLIDDRTSSEAARLRDLTLMRLHDKPRAFLKVCAPYLTRYSSPDPTSHTDTVYRSAVEPSTEALPCCWSCEPALDFSE
jgi:hypothetical protein